MRRYVMPLAGFGVAMVFLAPYIVMLLDALRPSTDVVQSPPTLIPREWQWDTFSTVLSDHVFRSWLKTSLIFAI
jgi:multiple sugar transport system permease protein